jgi:glutamyl-tRNA reductase
MPIILVGLNHRTAPVELREQLSLTGCALDMALNDLSAAKEAASLPGGGADADRLGGEPFGGIHESVILSTCNRLEVYANTADPAAGFAAIQSFLCKLQGLQPEALAPHLYLYEDQAAVDHLMRVASGLDSLILGEPQILGQVAEAYAHAKGAGDAGPVMSELFTRALHAGKRARSETAISRHTTSASHAAARLARDTFGDLAPARVLIVGAGEMAELAATALYDEGARCITCINRTYARAAQLARRYGGEALNWSHLPEALAQADVIVSATGAPHMVIYRDDVAQALAGRAQPLVIVDIALPRDVEAETGTLPGVVLYDVDDLQNAVDSNRALREAAVPQVETIIGEESEAFFCWLASRQVVPVLVELRRKAERVAEIELEQAVRRLGCSDPQAEQVMARLAHRIVNKLLHEPTVRLKQEAAAHNGIAYADALRELFALDSRPHEVPCLVASEDAEVES